MNIKKSIKIIAGLVVFFTLPSLLFFGFLYLRYHEDLPTGKEGKEADALAAKMLKALDYEAYKSTNYLEWTYNKRHHYKWKKSENTCNVYWKEFKVELNLNDNSKSNAYIHSFAVDGEQSDKLVQKANKFFKNDSFWLVAPYMVFDEGSERRLVELEDGTKSLLVTYPSGDSYLWNLNNQGKPESFKMWTTLLPLDGLEASWNHWIITESGAQLPTFHKILFMKLELTNVKGTN